MSAIAKNDVVRASGYSRAQIYRTSRAVIILLNVVSLGTLFLIPTNPYWYALDVIGRTYIMFLGTVMSHEGTHGLLGSSRSGNFFWGKLALIPVMVPFANFRKTHNLHHAYTNIPDKDPDLYVRPKYTILEVPLRALSVPHHWFFWLWKRGKVTRSHVLDLLGNYVGIFSIYAVFLYFLGWDRMLWGMVPSLILVSHLLWYPFAAHMHGGFSTGAPETRSHDYYGTFMYWFSLGLSLHRVHHMHPELAWMEMRPQVQKSPKPWWSCWIPHRDIQLSAP